MTTAQTEHVAHTLAELILETVAWDEPLDGDQVELLVEAFEKRLKAHMGIE